MLLANEDGKLASDLASSRQHETVEMTLKLHSYDIDWRHALGSGAFGRVYRAVCKRNRENVYALKEMDMKKASPQIIKMAEKEAKTLRSLKHKYIIEYRDSFWEESSFFVVMELALGGDVQDLIDDTKKRGEFIDEDTVVKLMTQSLLALEVVHDKKVIHRDIKPENIMLTKAGDAKLTDFGMAGET